MTMTAKIQAKRDEYNAKVSEINHLLDQNVNNIWSDELKAQHDTKADELERLGNQIEAMVKAEKRRVEEEFTDVDEFRIKDTGGKGGQVSDSKKAIDIFMRKGDRHLTAEESLLIRNTMSTTTNTEGGYTVQSEVASQLIDYIKEFRYMREEAAQMTTAMGNPMSYPTSDGTTEVGEVVAQNTLAASQDITFGTVPLNVFKYSSKIIVVPIELLQDSEIDIPALVFKRAGQRIGRITNQHFTTGTGTGQAQGFVPVSSVGKIGTTGQTSTIIYDDLVDLIDSLDYGYQTAGRNLCFMGSQAMRKVLRKIKDTAGRPIWTPSYEGGLTNAFKDTLLGYDFCINNDIAVPAANAKSLAFGDFRQYLIRDAMEVSFFRFDDSAYMTKGQIGYLAWSRTGGNLLDVNAIKLYQHSAT